MEDVVFSNWLDIDLGGSKLATRFNNQMLIYTTPPNQLDCLSLIDSLITTHQAQGCAIASPGNINNEGVIAPNSARNLSTNPSAWDSFNWIHWLSERVTQYVVINDAMAQLLGCLPPTPFPNETIGYIGPGTGLGGGFVQLENATLRPISDGHIFDIMLEKDPYDRWASTPWVMAEDVLSGRGYNDRVGTPLSDTHHPDRLRYATLMGRYLRQLISRLRAGSPTKQIGPQWQDTDIQKIQRVSKWVVGGGIINHADVGECIQKEWPPHEWVQWIREPINTCFAGLDFLKLERYGRHSRIRLDNAETASSVWALYSDARNPPADR